MNYCPLQLVRHVDVTSQFEHSVKIPHVICKLQFYLSFTCCVGMSSLCVLQEYPWQPVAVDHRSPENERERESGLFKEHSARCFMTMCVDLTDFY